MKYAALQAAKLLLLAVLAVLLWGTLHADPQQADFSENFTSTLPSLPSCTARIISNKSLSKRGSTT